MPRIRSSAFLALLLLAWPFDLGGQQAERPNIVLIVTDDQGYGDFGFAGNPVIRTVGRG